jgi:creatinine amidohydrolase/Fe(II)-dependent formamide hydrolase-like protein
VLELYDVEQEDILEKQKCTKHACESETSVMMYLFPNSVRKEAIEDFLTSMETFIDYLEHKRDEEIVGYNGCQGFPSYASPEKGKIIYERMLRRVSEKIEQTEVY